ncbi:MAG: hypothetical protein PHH37_12225 [Paludibacter sp.]|nr:hypothetical protein [Paludibacter sp.]
MKSFLFTIIMFCIYTNIFSQIENILPSPQTIAGASVANFHDYSVFQNPSNIAFAESNILLAQYENKFIIRELSRKGVSFTGHTNLLNYRFSFSHFGYSLYNEILLGAGFARNFANKFSMGLQFDYYTFYSGVDNKYRSAFFPQFGINVLISPVFYWGFQALNPFQTNIKCETTYKRIPSVYSLGFCYLPVSSVKLLIQTEKEVSSDFRLATGLEYTMKDFLTFKSGVYYTYYLVPCLGFSFKYSQIQFGLNTDIHPLLGLISNATLSYSF